MSDIKMKRTLWYSAALAAVVWSGPAWSQAASTCAAPTEQQCSDPKYLATDCGKQQRPACDAILKKRFATEYQGTAVAAKEVLVGNASTHGNQSLKRGRAKVLADDLSGHFTAEVPTSFRGTVQNFKIAARAPSQLALLKKVPVANPAEYAKAWPTMNAAVAEVRPQKDSWAANGTLINSCREYVYEHFYDYSKFEEAAAALGTDHRAIFELARRKSAPGLQRPLKTLANQDMPQVLFPNPLRLETTLNTGVGNIHLKAGFRHSKNGYFDAYARMQKRGFSLPAPLHAAFADEKQVTAYFNDWAFHEKASAALSSHLDEELSERLRQQEALGRLVSEWEDVVDEIKNHGATGDGRDRIAEKTALEDAITRAFAEGNAAGCANRGAITACDWSPRQFVAELQQSYLAARDREFNRCVELTATQGFNGISAPMKTSSHAFEQYLAAVEKKREKLVAALPGDGGAFAQSVGDSEKLGNDGEFPLALAYSYGASWGLIIPADDKLGCAAELKGGAHFKVGVDVFGQVKDPSGNLISLGASYLSNPKQVSFKHHFKLLGQDVYSPISAQPQGKQPYTVQKNPKKNFKKGAKRDFVVFAVPVTVEAGLTAGLGIDLKSTLDARTTCDAKLKGTVKLASISGSVSPWARAEVNAAAGVGWSFASAGVKGRLLVIDAKNPFHLNSALQAQALADGTPQVLFALDTGSKSELRTLDGSISAYYDTWLGGAERELISWDGLSESKTWFAHDLSVPVLKLPR